LKHNILAVLSVAIATFVSSAASAAPPPSCAGKFIGVWNHGNNNIGTLHANGVASCSGNSFCTQGTWTCEGNTLLYTNPVQTYQYQLQPNGTMTYNNIVVTRIGGNPSPARERAVTPSTAVAAPYPEKQVYKNDADALVHAGEAAENEGSASGYSVAEGNYLNAADKYRKAGDFKNERIARAKAANVANKAQRLEARELAKPRKRLVNNRLANPGSANPPTKPTKKITQEWLDKVSLRKKLKPRDEQLCAAYTAELNSYTGQSAEYKKELTAAVKGACN